MKNALVLFVFLLFSFLTFAQKNFPDSTDTQRWEVVTWSFFFGSCQTSIVKTGATVTLCDGRWTEVIECDYDEQYCSLAGYYRIHGDSVMIRHKDIVLRNGQWEDTVYCNEPEGLMYYFSVQLDDTLQCRVTYAGNSDTEAWNIARFREEFEGDSLDVLEMNFRPYTNIPEVIWTMDWTQGIGSTIHPFYSLACMGDHCEIEQQTTRAWRNGNLIYEDTSLSFTVPCLSWVSNDAFQDIELRIYPNPAHDIVEIELKGIGGETIKAGLFDAFGRRVKVLTMEEGSNRVRLQGLTPGLYLMKVDVGGFNHVEKLIIE